MESVQSVNQHMKNTSFNVGVIQPPDSHYKPVLYSHVQASRDFNRLDEDIYHSMKTYEGTDTRKTPKSVFVALGAAALAICYPIIKTALKK